MDATGLERLFGAGGAGASSVREAPPPPPLAIFRASAYRDARRRAAAHAPRPQLRKAFVFPIWLADRGAAWSRAMVVGFEDGSFVLYPGAALADMVVLAVVEDTAIAIAVAGSGNDVRGALITYRNKHYSVAELRVLGRVDRLERVIDAPGVARPEREVDALATDAVPAVAVGDLDIGEYLDKVVRRIRFAADA